jgi:hypothetical protein
MTLLQFSLSAALPGAARLLSFDRLARFDRRVVSLDPQTSILDPS